MYAIIKTGGKQYTVEPGTLVDVEKIEGEAGTAVELPVLFFNDGSKVVVGEDAASIKCEAEIVDQHKGKKQIVFKFKKRKGYKRTKGHRQNITRLRVTSINGVKAEATKKAAKPAEAEKVEAAPAEEPVAKKPEAEAVAGKDLSKLTVAQLKELAAERGIKVSSSARKAEIIEIIQNAQ